MIEAFCISGSIFVACVVLATLTDAILTLLNRILTKGK